MLRKYKWVLLGSVIGAAAGWSYWNFVGCASGTCMITSVWYNSTMYGALMGGLLISSFSPSKTETKKN